MQTSTQAREGARVRPRALVIEDREDVRYLVSRLLRSLGYEVEEAGDGATGVYLARVHRPEVVLVDIVLPDTDGYQLAPQLRAALGASARLAAMTAFTWDRARSFEAGFDQHFSSPVDAAMLQSWLGRGPRPA